MRRLSIILSALFILLSLIGIGLFFTSLPGIIGGDSDGLVYLVVLLPLIYSSFILFRLTKDQEFCITHKFSVHLLTWPTIIAIIVSIIFAVTAVAAGEGLGLWAAIMALVFGILLATILSLIGFIVDFVRNK